LETHVGVELKTSLIDSCLFPKLLAKDFMNITLKLDN